MSVLATKALAKSLRFDGDNMWVDLSDGRQLGVPLAYFPRLLRATPEQLEQYVISGGGTGLHWDDLDEDISVEGLLRAFLIEPGLRSVVLGSWLICSRVKMGPSLQTYTGPQLQRRTFRCRISCGFRAGINVALA